MIVAPALGAAVIGALAHGALYPNSPLFGRVIAHVRTDEPLLALTFDDGPNPEATPAILDALGTRGIRASFFILGRHAQRWPDLVRRIAANRMIIYSLILIALMLLRPQGLFGMLPRRAAEGRIRPADDAGVSGPTAQV